VSIDNPREVPEQWHPHFEKLGIELSYRALERKAEGVGLNTIVRALTGEGKATSKTVADTIERVTIDDCISITANVPSEWPVSDRDLEAVAWLLYRRRSQVADRLRNKCAQT
jgi:hypothetical protein